MVGTIGVPCTDLGRYSAFTDSLSNLDRPPGTQIRMAVCNWRHYGRNQLVRWMLEEDHEWLFMVDDDHVFAPDLLTRLLSHEVDIVAALCLRRDAPYGPFCFGRIISEGVYEPLDLNAHGYQDLVKVAAVGTGAILVRRKVFEKIGDPYFRISERSGEDMLFCADATRKGFDIYCDLGARLGHLTTAAIWPAETPGDWRVGFVISDETRFTKDLPEPEGLSA